MHFYNVARIFNARGEKSKKMGRAILKLRLLKDSRWVLWGYKHLVLKGLRA